MIDWIKRVFDKLAIKYENVRKGVDEIMGGYILHTRTDDILDQGVKQGLDQGLNQGRNERGREDAIRMYEDGMPVEKIAKYVDETKETVMEWVEMTASLV